jgi:hypothetical protein
MAGAVGGSVAADWLADRMFGDEAPRMAEHQRQKEAEKEIEQYRRPFGPEELAQMAPMNMGAGRVMRNTPYEQRYLAQQFLSQSPYQGSFNPYAVAAPQYI